MTTVLHMLRGIVQTDMSGFARNMQKAAIATQDLAKKWADAAKAIDRAATRITTVVGGVALGIAGSVAKIGISFDAMSENAEVAFSTMLGSAEKAKKFMEELKAFAIKTPFEMPGLVKSAQKLLAFGFAAEQILPMLTAVGDAAAGLGGSPELLDRITLALGQIKAKGKVSAQEMNQLAEAGIPAWEILAKKIGTDIPTAMKQAENGAISASIAVPAILEGLTDRFGGQMEKLSHKFTGLLSNIKDALTQAAGKVMLPAFHRITEAFSGVVDAMSGPRFQVAVDRIANQIGALVMRLSRSFSGITPDVFIGGLESAVSGAIDVFGRLAIAASEVVPTLLRLAGGFARFLGQAMNFVAQHPQILNALVTLKVFGFFGLIDVVIRLATAIGSTLPIAFGSLRAAMISTGIGAVIVAVGLLIAHFDQVKAWIEANSDIFGDLFQSAKSAWEQIAAAVLDAWQQIRPTLVELAVLIRDELGPAVKELAPLISDLLKVSIANLSVEIRLLLEVAKPLVELFAGQLKESATALNAIFGDMGKSIGGAGSAMKGLSGPLGLLGLGGGKSAATATATATESGKTGSGLLAGWKLKGETTGSGISRGFRFGEGSPFSFRQFMLGRGAGTPAKATTNAASIVDETIPITRGPIGNAAPNQAGRQAPGANPRFANPSPTEAQRANQAGIQQAMRDAQLSAMNRQTPGSSNFRSIFGMEGITPVQVQQMLGLQKGVTPGMASGAANIFGQNQGNSQALDALAQSLAKMVNDADTLKQSIEQGQPVLHDFAQKIFDLDEAGKLSKESLNGFSGQALALHEQLKNGSLSIGQFSNEMQALTQATNEAVAAAAEKKKQEQREALLKGDFKGAGLDIQKAVQDKLAAFRMSQFSQQVETAWQKFARLNGLIPAIGQGFQGLKQNMTNFGTNMQKVGQRVAQAASNISPQQAGQAWSRITSFLASKEGLIGTIRSNIALLQQDLSVVDTARRRIGIENQIGQMVAQLRQLLTPVAPPVLGVNSLSGVLYDPGLSGRADAGHGKAPINVHMNSAFPPTPEMARQFADSLEQELNRRGFR